MGFRHEYMMGKGYEKTPCEEECIYFSEKEMIMGENLSLIKVLLRGGGNPGVTTALCCAGGK